MGEICAKGIHHVGMRSCHFDETVTLYQEALGFRKVYEWTDGPERCYMLDTGDGSCIEIFSGGEEELPSLGRFNHLALRVDDCRESYARAIAIGARPKVPPTYSDIAHAKPHPLKMWFAYVIGFDGEEIEFIQIVED